IADLLADERRELRAVLRFDRWRCRALDVEYFVVADRIAHGLAEELIPVPSEPEATAEVFLFERALAATIVFGAECIDTRGEVLLEEVGLGEAEIQLRVVAGKHEVRP